MFSVHVRWSSEGIPLSLVEVGTVRVFFVLVMFTSCSFVFLCVYLVVNNITIVLFGYCLFLSEL